MTNENSKPVAGQARLARRREERLRKETATPRREPHNIYLLPKREKPAPGAFGPPSPEIGDVGGYDNYGNLL